MKHIKYGLLAAGGIAVSVFALHAAGPAPQGTACTPINPNKATPFLDNNGCQPPPGSLTFNLSSNWPSKAPGPLVNPPWRQAIGNGKITVANASAYAAALKAAVAPNARTLIMDQKNWNAANAGWYNEPWVGSQREAISGTYPAGQFGPSFFPGTKLKANFDTHVLTYYDARAAHTLYKVWNASAESPIVTPSGSQFAEGAIVVKAAVFAPMDRTKKPGWWEAMEGAQIWDLYLSSYDKKGHPTDRWTVGQGYVAQFDIIVKDTASAPQTGWVYMTLVYDKDAKGATVWDKMVPLGVQWGNDPQSTSPSIPLKENWINPEAPKYSTQTLGWGGRLAGPNDGATNAITFNGKAYENFPNSGCLSCHSTAEWSNSTQSMPVFLLPTTSGNSNAATCNKSGQPDSKGSYICSPAPGSRAWMQWFQNRPGNVPMTPGTVAMDFDEVFSFKSLRLWRIASTTEQEAVSPTLARVPGARRFNLYNGAPIRRP